MMWGKYCSNLKDLFSEPTGLPPDRSHNHHIPLKPGSEPINVQPYHYPHYMKGEIEKLVSSLLQLGVIRPSTNTYSSLVLMVKKRDGLCHLYVDYRALNQITIKDKFPIPIINKLSDELNEAKKISKLDLHSGYHQIKMHVEYVEKRHYERTMGVTNFSQCYFN